MVQIPRRFFPSTQKSRLAALGGGDELHGAAAPESKFGWPWWIEPPIGKPGIALDF